MGCLIQMFTQLLGYFLWYLVLYPLLVTVTFLKDIGLIWSISFYVITHFMFLDTFIQDYRILITVLLLIPFVLKTLSFILRGINRYLIWSENRAEKKATKVRQKEEANNFYEQE